jgi:hypothetical protein
MIVENDAGSYNKVSRMNIVVCPYCGMKVIPKTDGTCPSCLSPTNGNKKARITKVTTENENYERLQDRMIWAGLGFIWFLFLLSFFMSSGTLTSFQERIVWRWWPGIIGAIILAILSPFYLFVGLSQRQAYRLYLLMSAFYGILIFPLLATGYLLLSNQVSILVASFSVLILSPLFAYQSKFHSLLGNSAAGKQLNKQRHRWNLSGGFFGSNQGDVLTGKVLSLPLLFLVMLCRLYPQSIVLYAILLFAFATYFISLVATCFATSNFIRAFEKDRGKTVRV